MKFKKLTASFIAIGTAIATSVTPMSASARGLDRDCSTSSYPMLYDFAQVQGAMNERFGAPNKYSVWQAANDDAVWDAWCVATHSTALMRDGKLISNRMVTFPNDGSTAYFREQSRSGGYTIDFRKTDSNRTWKVHVR